MSSDTIEALRNAVARLRAAESSYAYHDQVCNDSRTKMINAAKEVSSEREEIRSLMALLGLSGSVDVVRDLLPPHGFVTPAPGHVIAESNPIDDAVGFALDNIGMGVGMSRYMTESDIAYRKRVQKEIARRAATDNRE